MFKHKRIIIGSVVSLAFFLGLLVVLGGHGQTTQKKPAPGKQVLLGQSAKEIDDAAAPIVDLANPDPIDRIDKNARRLKNARHDKSGPFKIDTYPNASDVRADPERRAGFSDLPADKSDLIVEAVVVESKAFLSEDRTGVYSEFTILVSRILKDTTGSSINLADRIVAERFGGRVRYPTGQVVRWRISSEGVPIVGKTYIFFLAKADQDSYKLLTAYEILDNKIFAIDGPRTEPRGSGSSIFDKHNGEAFDTFMREVETAIRNSRNGGAQP